MSKPKLGILISGRGSNMVAILQAIEEGSLNAEVSIVISNKPDVMGLKRAEARGVSTQVVLREPDIIKILKENDVDLVVLAGFMKFLSAEFIQSFANRILNVHPSLLPAFKGLNAQKQALESGVKEAGCTVHLVTEELDSGPILGQVRVPVEEGDTVESLSQRILVQEHLLYPKVVAQYLEKINLNL